MKLFYYILALTPLCFLAGTPDKQLEMTCIRPTVKVMDEAGYGTGTIIRSEKLEDGKWLNVVLTAAHVTKEMEVPQILIPGWVDWSKKDAAQDQKFEAVVYAQNLDRDMALVLFISPGPMPTAELGMDKELYLGNDVQRVGFNDGDDAILETGKVTGVDKTHLKTAMNGVYGYSGGPVYHQGKIVAITQSLRLVHGMPVWGDSDNVRITELKRWAESEKSVKIYDKSLPLPKINFTKLVAEFLKK
jgi:hypothetical protein